jgi:hypothetical protein
MRLNEVYSNAYAKVEANPEKELVQLTWLKQTSGAPLRQVLEKTLQYAIKEGIRLWLFDLRMLSYTTMPDQNWSVTKFFPAFDQRKRHRLACVVPPDRVDLLPDNLIQEAIQANFFLREHFDLHLFTDKETAELWLFL